MKLIILSARNGAVPALLILALACLSSPSQASGAMDQISVTFDAWRDTPAGPHSPRAVLSYSHNGQFEANQFGIPSGVQVRALTRKGDKFLFVPNVTFRKDGVVFTPRDIVKVLKTGDLELYKGGASLSLSPPARISALSSWNDEIFIVLDTTTTLDGKVFTPQDVIRYSNKGPEYYFKGSDFNIPRNTRIMAIEVTTSGRLIFSFASTLLINETVFRRSDLAQINPHTDDSIVLFAKREAVLGNCFECRVLGLSIDLNEDVIFRTRFYDPWR